MDFHCGATVEPPVAPLWSHVAAELGKDAAIAKEKRQAAEARATKGAWLHMAPHGPGIPRNS